MSLTSANAQTPGPADLVDALNGAFGRHAGARGSHAKGQCVIGTFEPAAALRGLTRAALFDRPSLDVVGRLSIGGGNPQASDKSRTVRGLALSMQGGSHSYNLATKGGPPALPGRQ